MKIAYDWLRELVPGLDLGATDLAERLTMAGLEVEAISDPASHWEGIVVGLVLAADKHPKADWLSLCKVAVGGGRELPIVCGAPNVTAGQPVAVALEGAVLPGGLSIAKTKLRGVESHGMICSARELGLGEDPSGILVLSGKAATAAPGTPLAQALPTTTVIEVSVTPNRGDCLSAWGLAREVAALTGHSAHEPAATLIEGKASVGEAARVEVQDPNLCPRYCARVIEAVTVGPSPEWLTRRLESHGMRPINNVVDVTNYILLLHGQPLHAFDLDQIADGTILVRKAANAEVIETLDGQERGLGLGMLVIADPKGPVAVAGVMGGARSEVGPATKRILLESAYFEPGQVRRTCRALGLSSESAYRFERGVDPNRVPKAMDHAAALIAELAGGSVRRGFIDVAAREFAPLSLRLRPARVCALLGLEVPTGQMGLHLRALGFEVQADSEAPGSALEVRVPTHRSDVTCEADLIEEIARMEGYEKVLERLPMLESAPGSDDEILHLRAGIEDALAARGWHQAVHLSFIEPSWPDGFGLKAGDRRRAQVRLENPINEEQSVLRSALLPSLLASYARNRNRGVRQVRLFELSRVFLAQTPEAKDELPEETLFLTLVAGGVDEPSLWRTDDSARAALFDLKADLTAMGKRLGVNIEPEGSAEPEPYLHPGRQGILTLANKSLGQWGELHPRVAERFGIRERVVVAELNARAMLDAAARARPAYGPVGRFPVIWRDLSLVLPEQVPAGELLVEALRVGAMLVRHAEVFDEFRGKAIGEGRRSLGIRLCYGLADRTLTEDEAAGAEEEVLMALERRFGASRRTQG